MKTGDLELAKQRALTHQVSPNGRRMENLRSRLRQNLSQTNKAGTEAACYPKLLFGKLRKDPHSSCREHRHAVRRTKQIKCRPLDVFIL
jgi:hypothetical protein